MTNFDIFPAITKATRVSATVALVLAILQNLDFFVFNLGAAQWLMVACWACLGFCWGCMYCRGHLKKHCTVVRVEEMFDAETKSEEE